MGETRPADEVMADAGRGFAGAACKLIERGSWRSLLAALVYAILELADAVRGVRWSKVDLKRMDEDA